VEEKLFEHLAPTLRIDRQELAGLFREVDEDRRGLAEHEVGVAGRRTIDQDRHLAVRIEGREGVASWLTLAKIDGDEAVGQAHLLGGDGDLDAVGCREGVNLEHWEISL